MSARRKQIGLLTAEPDRLLLAQCVLAGLDFVVLDAEQTGLDVRRCADVVLALAGTRTEVHIRVPDLQERTLVEFANTGADELLLPQVRRLAEVETAYAATRYAPAGRRSRQVSPASCYGSDFGREPRLSLLIETVDVIDDLAAFASSELLDSMWVGPTDLKDDLHRSRPGDASAVDQVIDHVVDELRAAGRGVGLPAGDTTSAAAAFARGADRVAIYWERFLGSSLTAVAKVCVP